MTSQDGPSTDTQDRTDASEATSATSTNGHAQPHARAHNGHGLPRAANRGNGNGRAIDLLQGLSTRRRVALSAAAQQYCVTTKLAMDRFIALTALVILAPIILMVSVAIGVTLGRPVLIRQRRVGQHGRVFDMYKFRTMHPDRRSRRAPLLPAADRRQRHKSADDPRHTPLGRLLRRYSLDELPQLWNVVRGGMSLVGPRPELEHVAASYAAWQHQRHLVKPGITGLWQVTERGSTGGEMHHHTHIDLDYIERLSLRADLWILLRTLPAAIGSSRGE